MSLDHVNSQTRSPKAGANGLRKSRSEHLPRRSSGRGEGESSADLLTQLAAGATHDIPGACGASVILAGADGLDFWGVSAPFVAELERAQQRLEQGPRIEATRRSDTVLSGSITDDARWPLFGREIRELGVGSALVQPLVTSDGVLGTLAVYGDGEQAFDSLAVQLASVFVGPAALAAQAATWSPSAAADPTEQQGTHPVGVIERALGIMMSRSACSQDWAILRLQKMSEADHQHLATVAQAVIDEALVESSATYVRVRQPHRPFGRRAPGTDPPGIDPTGWGRAVQERLP